MLKFSANLTMLYNEVGFLERFGLAAKAGFKGCEFKDPFAYGKADVVAALKDSLMSGTESMAGIAWANVARQCNDL